MAAQLLIFDCDGVPVDSEPIAARVLSEALVELGLDETPESVDAKFRGRSIADILRQIESELGRPLPSEFTATLTTTTRAAFEVSLQPVPGVRELLAELAHRGLDLCVASSGSPEKINHSLGLTELLPFFEDRIFSAFHVTRGKPAPDLFLHAAAQMGHPSPSCAMIEDSGPGVTGAVASGAQVLGYVPPGKPDLDERRRTLLDLGAPVFHAMYAVPGLIG